MSEIEIPEGVAIDTAGADLTETDQGEHPAKAGLIAFHKALGEGSTRDTACDEYFGRVMTAAAAGDERVIWRPNDRQRETLAKS